LLFGPLTEPTPFAIEQFNLDGVKRSKLVGGETVMAVLCQRIVNSPAFSKLILVLIVVSGTLVGIETYPQFSESTQIGQAILFVQEIILWAFVVEAALKIAANGSKPWRYFMNPWNVFDFAIIAICFLPIDAQFAVVFRMARLLRALRLLTILPDMQVLVSALLRAIPSLGSVGILLLLHFYVYAVMGTFLFHQNDPIRFAKLHNSMLTLFQVLTLEGWNDVFNTQYLGSDKGYDDAWKEAALQAGYERENVPQPGVASAFFVSFIVLGTMIVLNLFTGVIISSMEATRASPGENGAQSADEIQHEVDEKGFMTLRDELELIASHLREVSADVVALSEQTRELRLAQLGSDATND
jgi:voltage-gated sodium channel